MGIHCQIHLQKPKNGIYNPGSRVKGTVLYALSKETVFSEITVSIRGRASVYWSEGSGRTKREYSNKEDLYTASINLLEKSDGMNFPVESYKAPFEFILPNNIPSSYSDDICKIIHKVRIKFKQHGIFNFPKIFSTDIPVVGYLLPVAEHQEYPVVYGLMKKLGFFGNKLINMKATAHTNTLRPGENGLIEFEVSNETSRNLDDIKVTLIESKKYISSGGHAITKETTIPDSKVRYDTIEKAGVSKFEYHLTYPEGVSTVQHTKVFKRNLFVKLTVNPPVPYMKTDLRIPMYLGCTSENQSSEDGSVSLYTEEEEYPEDPPPSYWEVMVQDEKNADQP